MDGREDLKRNEMARRDILSNLIWKLMQSAGNEAVQFVVQLILARLLLPEDYGMVAITTVFISISNIMIQRSFNTALIQKKDADEADFSSVFYVSLAFAGLLFLLLYASAPYLAGFYGEPVLKPLLRSLSVTLFAGAVNSIQLAVIARNMQFRKLFRSSLCAMILAGAVGIAAASSGWGVWALAAYQITNQFTNTLILWFTVKWRPKRMFSFRRIRSLFSFGGNVLAASFLDAVYENLLNLVIGKLFSASMLGFFQKGLQFPVIVVSNFDGAIQNVMFPALASRQEEPERIRSMVRRSVVTSTFLIFPMMAGLAAVAEPLVTVLLTEKWLACVPFLQVYCFTCALWPVQTSMVQAINALGRSDITLRLESVRLLLAFLILLATVHFGIYAIAYGAAAARLIFTFINARFGRKLLNYAYAEQWKDIMPSFLLSLAMGFFVWGLRYFELTDWMTLAVQIVSGAVFYIAAAKLLKLERFHYILTNLKELVKK